MGKDRLTVCVQTEIDQDGLFLRRKNKNPSKRQ